MWTVIGSIVLIGGIAAGVIFALKPKNEFNDEGVEGAEGAEGEAVEEEGGDNERHPLLEEDDTISRSTQYIR